MLPEFTIDGSTVTQGIAYGAVMLIVWFAKRNLTRIESDVSNKADKDHMEREIEGLKMELKETRVAAASERERDIERLERAQAEKFAEFSSSMKDRLTTMERNVGERIGAMREDMGGKLDMIMQVINQLRKE